MSIVSADGATELLVPRNPTKKLTLPPNASDLMTALDVQLQSVNVF